MTVIQEQARKAMDSLHKSVAKALDTKQRLGQYAVIWEDGKIVKTLADDTPKNDASKPCE